MRTPAISTVHAVLDRHGLVNRRRRRRYKAQGTALSKADRPNELWWADYKGEFVLADRRYCYPLTISDVSSRYLLACDALSTIQEKYAFVVFERVFKEFGLPNAIRPTPRRRFGGARGSRTTAAVRREAMRRLCVFGAVLLSYALSASAAIVFGPFTFAERAFADVATQLEAGDVSFSETAADLNDALNGFSPDRGIFNIGRSHPSFGANSFLLSSLTCSP